MIPGANVTEGGALDAETTSDKCYSRLLLHVLLFCCSSAQCVDVLLLYRCQSQQY